MSETVAEPDPLERRGRRVDRVRMAGQFQRDRHVLQGGHRRQQVKRLEDDADMPPPQAGETVFIDRG